MENINCFSVIKFVQIQVLNNNIKCTSTILVIFVINVTMYTKNKNYELNFNYYKYRDNIYLTGL